MYNKNDQLLPLITPEMFRTMPDQTCDILNRLIRFYQEYQRESSVAIQNNSNSINSLNSAIGDIIIPTVGNGQLTVQQNGNAIGTFTANQSGNTTIDVVIPTDISQIGGTISSSQIGNNTITSDNIDWATMKVPVPDIQNAKTITSNITSAGIAFTAEETCYYSCRCYAAKNAGAFIRYGNASGPIVGGITYNQTNDNIQVGVCILVAEGDSLYFETNGSAAHQIQTQQVIPIKFINL